MFTRRRILSTGAAAAVLGGGLFTRWLSSAEAAAPAKESFPVSFTDEQWRSRLSAAQYDVLRREGTERPYSSPLNKEHRAGQFSCAGCAQPLFSSRTKFDSGTGWPSFWQPIDKAVATERDTSYGMVRDAVHCTRCGGHLGHVFDDGPKPTGLRYCMNGVAMNFNPQAA